jgi:hypothetical protein
MADSNTVLMNLDSKDGTPVLPADWPYAASVTPYYPHVVSHTLIRPLKGVKTIRLKSLELPITSDNVRFQNQSTRLGLVIYASGVEVQTVVAALTTTTYTSIATLVADLNASIVAQGLSMLGGSAVPVVSYVSSATGGASGIPKIIITWAGATGIYTFKVITNGTLYNMGKILLGFNGTETVNAGNASYPTSLISSFSPTLNPDNYYNVQVYSNQMNLSSVNNSSTSATFKLPISATKGVIMFWNDLMGFEQTRDVEGGVAILNSLTVRITDRWGYDLMQQADFSVTLQIECESF